MSSGCLKIIRQILIRESDDIRTYMYTSCPAPGLVVRLTCPQDPCAEILECACQSFLDYLRLHIRTCTYNKTIILVILVYSTEHVCLATDICIEIRHLGMTLCGEKNTEHG
jgi:hypothetical protein